MRLGQLSRKISVRSAEITAFLSTKGITLDENANTRVPDDAAMLVISHFAPDAKLDDVALEEAPPASIVDILIKSESVAEEKSSEDQGERSAEPTETPQGEAEKLEDSVKMDELPQVIKAPKVELQGLKVLGKIELPEQKKKEPVADPESTPPEDLMEQQPQRRRERDQRKPRHDQSGSRPRKNPIAAKRDREAREAEERKKAQQEKEKEKRTQYYMQRVKTVAPPKRVSIVDEPLSQLHEEVPDEPKSLWGKFMRWLTSH
jgi:hypothetical protein